MNWPPTDAGGSCYRHRGRWGGDRHLPPHLHPGAALARSSAPAKPTAACPAVTGKPPVAIWTTRSPPRRTGDDGSESRTVVPRASQPQDPPRLPTDQLPPPDEGEDSGRRCRGPHRPERRGDLRNPAPGPAGNGPSSGLTHTDQPEPPCPMIPGRLTTNMARLQTLLPRTGHARHWRLASPPSQRTVRLRLLLRVTGADGGSAPHHGIQEAREVVRA